MSIVDQGWGYPGNSRKAHYYLAGEMISICGRWAFTGTREDDKHESRDNCTECKRKRAKLATVKPTEAPGQG